METAPTLRHQREHAGDCPSSLDVPHSLCELNALVMVLNRLKIGYHLYSGVL